MPAGYLLPLPRWQFFSNAGAPLAGGTLNTYASGTSTPLATYSNAALSSSNGTSITLNSAGRPTVANTQVSLFGAPGVAYRFTVVDSGGTTVWGPQDDIVLPSTTDVLPDTFVIGDLLVADSTTTLTTLPDVAVGSVLASMGVGVAPVYASAPAISAAVSGNALTVALTTAAGNTPTATAPAILTFRNVTAGTGSLTTVAVTSATTVVIPDTATLGTSNTVPFRFWIVAFNDGGTVRLGAINCANATSIYPLAGWGIASSTTIGTGSDSAQVFYSEAGVSSKAYVVLGYVTYESGLVTAGTYTSAPTRVQRYGPEVPLPGRPVQYVMATYSTPVTSSSSTYADTGLTASISPSSAANRVLVQVTQNGCGKDTGDTGLNLKLVRAAVDLAVLGFQVGNVNGVARNAVGSVAGTYLDAPGTTASTAYKTQFASAANIAEASVQLNNSVSTLVLTEIMG